MPVENNPIDAGPAEKLRSMKEEKERSSQTLEEYLAYLNECGIKTLSAEQIKKHLTETGTAIVAHKFLDGIRISKIGENKNKTWTTNNLENPDHLLAKKFGGKEIIIE